jgi:hypothetical protein
MLTCPLLVIEHPPQNRYLKEITSTTKPHSPEKWTSERAPKRIRLDDGDDTDGLSAKNTTVRPTNLPTPQAPPACQSQIVPGGNTGLSDRMTIAGIIEPTPTDTLTSSLWDASVM